MLRMRILLKAFTVPAEVDVLRVVQLRVGALITRPRLGRDGIIVHLEQDSSSGLDHKAEGPEWSPSIKSLMLPESFAHETTGN